MITPKLYNSTMSYIDATDTEIEESRKLFKQLLNITRDVLTEAAKEDQENKKLYSDYVFSVVEILKESKIFEKTAALRETQLEFMAALKEEIQNG